MPARVINRTHDSREGTPTKMERAIHNSFLRPFEPVRRRQQMKNFDRVMSPVDAYAGGTIRPQSRRR